LHWQHLFFSLAAMTAPRSMLAYVSMWMAIGHAGAIGTSSVAQRELIRGVSYGPVPLKSVDGASSLPADDWFCDEAVPMWGLAGRRDLRVMSRMGANMVRLYGNNPAYDHTNFLDEAAQEGLSVAPGMSDYPFYQMNPGSCLSATNFNCFSQVKPFYLQNLRNGFLTADKTYHPALRYMNILNEPDLKMPSDTDTGGSEGPVKMARSLISAFDGMLEAEKEAGVTGPLINFTATFSYAICASCGGFAGKPALGQMWVLDDAMRNPGKYGYTPVNDITAAYEMRFTHSFNTQNPATDLQHQFLDDYTAHFPMTPVYIGEYHRVHANQTEDLDLILSLAKANPLFLGISFFEYQVAYWKTGSEMDFGMFGLGDAVLASMPYFGKNFSIYCLTPQDSETSGTSIPDAVAVVYGGAAIDVSDLCVVNPLSVTLDQAGYLEVLSQKRTSQMSLFVERVINHMGATVYAHGYKHMNDLAQSLVDGSVNSGNGYSMADLASYLGSKPEWVDFDSRAKCVANRDVAPNVIGSAIGWTCSQNKSFSCDEIPAPCQNNTYRTADFVFSQYFGELGSDNPLVDCSFSGAAIYASSKLYNRWSGSARCVSDTDPVTSAPTTHIRSTTASFLQPSTSKGSGEVTSATLRSAVGQQMPVLLMLTLPVIVS